MDGFNIGTDNNGTDPFNGDLAELVYYASGLNETQLIILHNYFNTKYGSTGLTADRTKFNPPAGFTNELIGIGRDNNVASAVTSTQSSTGGITISSTTSEFLSEVGRYLLAAHDGEPAEFLTVDAASNTRRVERAWYVQKTSNEDEITSDGEVSINVNFDEVPDIRPTIPNDAFYVVYNENDPTFPAATNQILPISSFTTNTSGTTITDITITADAIYIDDGYYALFAQPYDPTDPDDPTNGDVSVITSNETTIGAGTVEMVGNYPGVRVQGNSTLVLVPDNENLRILDNFVVEGGAGLHIKPNAEFSTPTGTRITLEPGARYLNEGDTDPYLIMQQEIGAGTADTPGWRLLSFPYLDGGGTTYAELLNYDSATGHGFWTQGRDIVGALQPGVGSPSVREYVDSSSGFQTPIPDLTVAIPNGKGFSAYVYNCNEYTETTTCVGGVDPNVGTWPKTIEIEGTEFRGSAFSVASLGSGTFNLVGNPYASAIAWNSVVTANPNKSNAVYVYDSETGQYITYTSGTAGDFNGIISPFQSFWVDVNGSNTNIQLPLNVRNVSTNYTFLKGGEDAPKSAPQDELPPAIRLLASADELSASMWFAFSEDGALGMDLFDAYQLSPIDRRPTMNASSFSQDGNQLDINALPADFDSVLEIPLNTDKLGVNDNNQWVVEDAITTLEWTELRNIPAGWRLEIRDNLTGELIDMQIQGSYTFDTADEAGTKLDRGQVRVAKDAFKMSYEFENGETDKTEGFGQDTRLSLIITPPNLNPNLHEAIITGPNEGWRMISAPIDGVTYEDLLGRFWTQGFEGADEETGTPNVFWFDETDRDNPQTNGWNVPSSMQDFVGSSAQGASAENTAGKTILVYIFEDDRDGSTPGFPKRLRLEGEPFTNSLTQTLSYTGDDDLAGFQLAGNPYKMALNWQNLLNDEANADAAFNEAIYIWDANLGESGAYRTMNASMQLGAGTQNEELPVLSSFQGFWVQATAENAELRFDPNHTTEEDAGLFNGPGNSEELPRLSFSMEGNNELAALGFSFSENGQAGYDRSDAYLLESLSSSYIQLFTQADSGEPLVINNLPLEAQELNLPIFVNASENGDMTLRLSGMSGMDKDWSITLTDNANGSSYTVDEGFEYTFSYEVSSDSGKRQAVDGRKASEEKPFNLTAPRIATPDKNMESRFTLNIVYGTTTSATPGNELPQRMQLSQNYPNPFNPSTRIDFALPEQAEVRLDIFDLMGRRVATVLNENRSAGEHTVMFDASNLASGVYLYRLQAAGEVRTQKMTLIK